METWRLRLPNEWEPLSHWADLLMWRNHMYNTVINVFRNLAELAPHLHQVVPPTLAPAHAARSSVLCCCLLLMASMCVRICTDEVSSALARFACALAAVGGAQRSEGIVRHSHPPLPGTWRGARLCACAVWW